MTPLVQARTAAFLWHLGEAGGQMALDGRAIRRLRWTIGATRGQLENIIDALADRGVVEVVPSLGAVWLRNGIGGAE